MKLALRLSLAVNVVVCSLGIFRVSLLHMSAADADADADHDVIADVTNRRPAAEAPAPNGTASTGYLVPNIVHYIWSARYFISSHLRLYLN